jgi:hypothetical protein
MQQLLDPKTEPLEELSTSERLRRRVESRVAHGYQLELQGKLEIMEGVVEVERTQHYRVDGFESTAEWLANFLGIGFNRACEFVEVTLALQNLPYLHEAFRTGILNYDHLRALTQIATEDNEQQLLKEARGLSVGATFRLVKRKKKISKQEAQERRRERWAEIQVDKDNGIYYLTAELPDESGAKVKAAIDKVAQKMPEDPSMPFTPIGVKRADALVALITDNFSNYVSAKSSKPLIVVHVDAEELDKQDGTAEIEGGPMVSVDNLRQISCDAMMQKVIHDEAGIPVSRGRTQRTADETQLRELLRLYGCCQFPGCQSTHGLQAHHVEEWKRDEGPTDIINLILLCATHHFLIHKKGWKVRGDPPKIWIERPNLPPIKPGPPRLTEFDDSS